MTQKPEAATPSNDNTQSDTDASAPDTLSGEQEAMESLAEAIRNATSDAPPTTDSEAVDDPTPRIAELEAENAALRDKALRATADAENTRRRAEREQKETTKFAVTGFARDLISVFENLSRASASISDEARKADAQLNNLAMGVDMTLSEMTQAFAKHQITRIDPMGQPFDHNLHQAMNKVETTEHPEGTVVQVLQAAYTIHDRLLQPALVAVATAPKSTDNQSGGDEAPQHVDTQA